MRMLLFLVITASLLALLNIVRNTEYVTWSTLCAVTLHVINIIFFWHSAPLWPAFPHFRHRFFLSGSLHVSATCPNFKHLKHLVSFFHFSFPHTRSILVWFFLSLITCDSCFYQFYIFLLCDFFISWIISSSVTAGLKEMRSNLISLSSTILASVRSLTQVFRYVPSVPPPLLSLSRRSPSALL